jgi:xylan 1,4-beta-xylosidase
MTFDDESGAVLQLVAMDDGRYEELPDTRMPVSSSRPVWLSCRLDHEALRFFVSQDGEAWHNLGPTLDATRLSDDYGEGFSFTGAFFALAAHDTSGQHLAADFDWFEYKDENH